MVGIFSPHSSTTLVRTLRQCVLPPFGKSPFAETVLDPWFWVPGLLILTWSPDPNPRPSPSSTSSTPDRPIFRKSHSFARVFINDTVLQLGGFFLSGISTLPLPCGSCQPPVYFQDFYKKLSGDLVRTQFYVLFLFNCHHRKLAGLSVADQNPPPRNCPNEIFR